MARQSITDTVRSNISDPQFRTGVDLVASAALNAVAGLAFWFVAARAFDEDIVGINAALISTMVAVANFSSLGMKNGLIRFLPTYGERASWLVTRAYVATAGTALVLAPLAAWILSARVEELDALGALRGNLAFTLACAVWIIFVLQDSVLIAVEKTTLIPISNVVHALAKLAVLGVLALSTPTWGIFAAWTVPVLAIVIWVNVVGFRSLRTYATDNMPSAASQIETTSSTLAETSPPLTGGLARFAAGEHASTVLNMALFGLLPIYILAELGEEASAFYALAWTIAYNLSLASSNVATALLAAAAKQPERLPEQVRKAAKQMALFVVPGAIGVIVFARIGMGIFGQSYAESGTTLLRLFALLAVINIPVTLSIGILRAQRQVARLFGLYAVRTAVVATLCVVFSRQYGLNGIGWGWLAGEGILAVGLVATQLRTLRS